MIRPQAPGLPGSMVWWIPDRFHKRSGLALFALEPLRSYAPRSYAPRISRSYAPRISLAGHRQNLLLQVYFEARSWEA